MTQERFLYLLLSNNRAPLLHRRRARRPPAQDPAKGRTAGLPPPEMIARQPYLPRLLGVAPAIPSARALYIGATVYRIHGTNARKRSAKAAGCFRLVNDDIIDLYERVPVGTQVAVHHR